MWWFVLACLLPAASQAFTSAAIKWGGLPTRNFVVSPSSLPSNLASQPKPLVLHRVRRSDDQLLGGKLFGDSPHFTLQSDKSIALDATGLCVEASGTEGGATVQINRCTGKPTQLWNVLRGRVGQQSQVNLKDTNMCLHVAATDGVLNGAPIQLRDCENQVTESWVFEEPLPHLTQNPSRGPASSGMRHVMFSFLAMAGLGALSLSATMWRRHKRPRAVAPMKYGVPMNTEVGGVSLSAASAVHQNAQTPTPAVMVMAPAKTEVDVELELKQGDAVALRDGQNAELNNMINQDYEFGFTTDIESETLPKGLNEDIVRKISEIKNEPSWMLDFRLRAFKKWQKMKMPEWAQLEMEPIDFQDIIYYSRPKTKKKKKSLDEVDPELLRTFEKLGIPLTEQKRLSNVAVDAVFDSESIGTTFQKELQEAGVIFCSIAEAIETHPELVKKYMGSVVPVGDNYFAALNSAVFSDGSFCYIPKGTRCPMEISTYFRINNKDAGQFERTLIIAEDNSYVSYLEGCTAPMFDSKQLHAAVVELYAAEDAEIKYSTVQNWYPGDKDGRGGILNLVTKRGMCAGKRSKISWTQVETGSAVTWKYPSCILKGDESVGEFYSVALTSNKQQADTGTKMIHVGNNTKSKIISKGISAGSSKNAYRGLVSFRGGADNCRNYSVCDSLLIGKDAEASTFPYIEAAKGSNQLEHEATTSRVSEEQLFYLMSRGLTNEEAASLVVSGFCQDVFNVLPMEFASEAQQLLSLKLEGTVG